MTITYTLPGFQLLNQLSEPSDGTPDQNARNNCVAASIADALNWFAGYGRWWGDELTDAVYGGSYIGPENAASYEAFCLARGVQLSVVNDTQAGLVALLHNFIKAGIPCLVTMPSQWGTPYADPLHPSGSTHVGVACGYGPGDASASGYLRVMNPWGGFWQDGSDAWWSARLCYGQIWPLEKASSSMSGVPAGWKDDGSVLTAPNGESAVMGFRSIVESQAWFSALQPIAPAYGIGGPNTRQDFALSTAWDGSSLSLVAAPELVHKGALDAAQAQVTALQAQVTSLTAQLAAAQASSTPSAQQQAASALAAAVVAVVKQG